MAKQTLTTNPVTFLDYTDERKLDVYISSNFPTTQIYDTNAKTYSPNWSTTTPLVLTADVYLDAKDVTTDAKTEIKWFEQVGTNSEVEINSGDTLSININKMASNALLTYICKAKYADNGDDSPTAIAKLTFSRVDTGSNGSSAPTVQAQYSVDGQTNWTAALNAATHKYVRYSYDGGKTWTTAIKMVGEDGTSITIKGTATSRSLVAGTSYYTLVYNSTIITSASLGDAYLLETDGHLYVCVNASSGNDYFMDVGQIQGPPGNDGESSYVFIRYATDASGANMTTSPSSVTTHIGICTANANIAPTTASSYTWSKFVGDSAKMIVLNGEAQVFKVNKDNVYTPSTIKVTAQKINMPSTTTLTWSYNVNDGNGWTATAPAGVALNTNTGVVTIIGATLASNSLVIKASDGVVEDVFTVYKAFDGDKGDSASMAFLTNENVSFSANANGIVTAVPITTNVVAYRGTAKQMPTVGTILDIPDGMNITTRQDTLLNEVELMISFDSNTNLGFNTSTSGTITIPITSPVVTNLKLSWSKINTGATGATGAAGADAYTVMLTNESHIFAGDVANAVAGQATTQALAYKGATAQSVTISSVNGKTAATIDTDTGIAGLKFKCSALSGTSPTITFTCTTAFVSASGTIPIVLSVGGVSFTKIFTYSIAFKGTTGATGTQGIPGDPGVPASLVDITPSAYYFKSTTGKDGTFTPDYIYLYPRFQTVTFSKWEYSINGGATWAAASGANGLTISTYNSIANTLRIARTSTLYTDTVTSISFRCVSSTASVYDTVSIAKIYDVVDLQIGGRNLILASKVPYSNSEYRVASYNMSEDWELNTTYTLTLKGTIETGKTFGAWANGSGTRVATLSYDASKGIYISTFTTPATIANQTPKVINIYNTPSTTAGSASIEWIKLEKGNKATDWSPAPEDLNNITFQIYAPNGYLLTNELQSITLQTFAYEGSIEITSGATFQWSNLVDDVWVDISGATNTSLTVTKTDVLKAKSYRCIMTYKNKLYTSTITIQDKTDTYNSIMCISSNAKGSECYWVLYTLVYSDTSEIDPLLGPISISAPASPVSGDYWYSVDSVNATVTLKKYNGTAWTDSTDKQSLTYLWNLVNDGSLKTPIGGASKVQVVSCRDFTATATIVCDVSDEVDGILTQSSLSITDASDPIVSQTEPANAVDGQIWIKPNTNGAYNMFIWSEAAQTWIANDIDTRNKVYTSKPSTYSKGDIWITESDTAHSKYLEGTLLQASNDGTTYSEDDWSATLKYDKDIEKINSTLYDLSQYVTITSSGLKIGAVNSSNELSPFTSLFTSTELAFYQNSDKLLTLANNQLTAPRIVVEEELEVNKKISLGNLQITIENNGSFSFAVTK